MIYSEDKVITLASKELYRMARVLPPRTLDSEIFQMNFTVPKALIGEL